MAQTKPLFKMLSPFLLKKLKVISKERGKEEISFEGNDLNKKNSHD